MTLFFLLILSLSKDEGASTRMDRALDRSPSPSARRATRESDPLERSLYDKVFRKDVNGFEEEVALYLDGKDAVSWWWRIVARKGWALQGWRRNRVYPDFLIKLESHGDTAWMLVLETKGEHLAGSHDSLFKEKLFTLLEQAYENGQEAGDVELFAGRPDAMRFRILLQQGAWKSELEHAIS